MTTYVRERLPRGGVVLLGALLASGGVVAYFGVRSEERIANAEPRLRSISRASEPENVDITLPHAEPALPPGPEREIFQASCTICHSTQLVLNQPPFPKAKWAETVHKMVESYGAPISPQEESQIVTYLHVARGKD